MQVLAEFKDIKNCVACCHRDGLYSNLETQERELEICKKALNDYMESKRRAFPRFYFVSAADLLDILSNGNNPVRVQMHMNKCFQVTRSGGRWFTCIHLLNQYRPKDSIGIKWPMGQRRATFLCTYVLLGYGCLL